MKKIYLLNILMLLLLGGFTAEAQISESFDGTEMPADWTVINLGSTNGWVFGPPGDGAPHSGSGTANITYNFDAAHDDYLVTPQVLITPDISDQLRFYARNNGTFYLEEFDVLLSTTGIEPADFTDTLESQIGPPATWTEYVYDLTEYAGENIYIAFHATSINQLKLHIDDVNIEKIPTCPKPIDLVSDIQTFTEVDISWTENGNATEWDVVYGIAGFDPATEGTTVNINTGTPGTTLSDLLPETSYNFYVRAVCGVDDESILSDMAVFLTGYCASVPTSNDDLGITNVQIATTNFPATDLTYLNFTGDPVDLSRGEMANTQIAFATGYTYNTNIWIDLNDNLVFEASELLYEGESLAANPTTLNASYLMPLDAPLGEHRMRISTLDYQAGDPDPCYSGSYGVTVDLDVNILEAPSCIAPSMLTLGEVTFTEANVGWTENGNAAQWEVIYGELGFDVETEGTTMYDADGTPGTLLTGLSAETWYEFYVRSVCGANETSNYSASLSFYTGYCVSVPTTNDGVGITNVKVATTNFPGTDLTYLNFSGSPVDLSRGEMANTQITFATGYTYNTNIWIDLNNNFVFEPSELLYEGESLNANPTTLNASFLMPLDAPLGVHRMRIVTLDFQAGDADPCYSGTYGVTVDVDVNILEAPDCIAPSNLTLGEVTNTEATIGWTENGDATQWEVTYGEFGFDPETEGTTIVDADGTPGTTLTGLTMDTAYEFYVRSVCGTNELSNFSASLDFFTGYCQYSGTNIDRYIDDFSTDGGIQNISNLETGDAPTGYANYTDQIVSQFATGIIDFTVVFDPDNFTYGCNIYIDWNDNMEFDEDENVYSSGGYVSIATGSITVPAGTALGDYRMRVVADWLNGNPPPCGTSLYGEAEDYTLSVIEAPTCLPATYLVVNGVTASTADLSWTENGDATEWEITYGETGFDPATEGTTVSDADGTPEITISGLTDNTPYQYYVRAICSPIDEAFISGPKAFRTLCLPTDVPYLQDFNSAEAPAIPFCTTRENLGDGNEWTTFAQNANGFTSVVLRYAYDFANPADAWFYVQGVNLVAGTNYQISYKYGNNSDFYSEKMRVSYGTAAGAASMVNELANYTDITGAEALDDIVYFTVDADGVYYFGFNVYSDENEFYLYVDDIEIKEAVACEAPTDVAVTDVINTSATVTWTESATATDGYTVEVFATGADPETATPVSTETVATGVTSSSATGLEAETTYDAYVTSNCGGAESMSDVITFTTTLTGVSEINLYGLTYYPNPVKDMLNISADTQIEDISVYNLVGKKVMQINPESSDFTMDVSNLASGSYLVKATINGSVSTFKLIKN